MTAERESSDTTRYEEPSVQDVEPVTIICALFVLSFQTNMYPRNWCLSFIALMLRLLHDLNMLLSEYSTQRKR